MPSCGGREKGTLLSLPTLRIWFIYGSLPANVGGTHFEEISFNGEMATDVTDESGTLCLLRQRDGAEHFFISRHKGL